MQSQYQQWYQQQQQQQQQQNGNQRYGGAPRGNAPSPPVPTSGTLTRSTDNRIDPANIPRPVYNKPFESHCNFTPDGGEIIPSDKINACPSSTLCSYIDKGIASPKFLRMSLSQIPTSKQTLQTSSIPLCVLVSVFPSLLETDSPVPVSDLSKYSPIMSRLTSDSSSSTEPREGPLKCPKCGAYANPFMNLSSSTGSCNFCSTDFRLPEYYAVALSEHRSISMSGPQWNRWNNNTSQLNVQNNNINNSEDEIKQKEFWKRPETSTGVVDHYLSSIPPSCLSIGRFRSRNDSSSTLSSTSPGSLPTAVPSDAQVMTTTGIDQIDRRFQDDMSMVDRSSVPMGSIRPLIRQAVILVVEFSSFSLSNNYFSSVLTSIKSAVQCLTTVMDICLVGFNREIFFFPKPKTSNSKNFQIVSMADVDAPFAPCSPSSVFHTIDPSSQKSIDQFSNFIDFVINDSSRLVNDNSIHPLSYLGPSNSQAVFSAISSAYEMLTSRSKLPVFNSDGNVVPSVYHRGGCILTFVSSPSSSGIGHIISDSKGLLSGGTGGVLMSSNGVHQMTSQDGSLNNQLNAFQTTENFEEVVSNLCAMAIKDAISFEIFISGSSIPNKDVYPLAQLAQQTGGRTHLYPKFSLEREYHHVYYDVQRFFTKPMGMDCSFKLRASKGISVKTILCPWSSLKTDSGGHGRDPSAFSIPRLDSDVAICFELGHEESAMTCKFVFVQFACVHTTRAGERKLRVGTVRIPLTQSLTTTFRCGDVDTLTAFLVRSASLSILQKDPQWREVVTNKLVEILHAYRLNAAMSSPSGQLVLPESMKLLPVYLAGLFKNIGTRPISSSLQIEEKIISLMTMLSAPVNQLMTFLYPRVYAIYYSQTNSQLIRNEMFAQLMSQVGTLQNDCYYKVAPSIPASGERLTTDGIFVLDTGFKYLIYFGSALPKEALESSCGSTDILAVQPTIDLNSVAVPGSLAERIVNVLKQLRFEKRESPYQPEDIVAPGTIEESSFIWHMVEDRLGSEVSYVDFLCQLHRTVQTLVEEG